MFIICAAHENVKRKRTPRRVCVCGSFQNDALGGSGDMLGNTAGKTMVVVAFHLDFVDAEIVTESLGKLQSLEVLTLRLGNEDIRPLFAVLRMAQQ